MQYQGFQQLLVWQKAMDLTVDCYRLLDLFPREEKYEIVSQLKRAAISIPSNIAEGYGRKTTAAYIKYLYIAYGSVCEL